MLSVYFAADRKEKLSHCEDSRGACWSASPFSLPAPSSCRIRSARPSRRWTDCAPAAWGPIRRIHHPWFKRTQQWHYILTVLGHSLIFWIRKCYEAFGLLELLGLTGFPDPHSVLGPLCSVHCSAEPSSIAMFRVQNTKIKQLNVCVKPHLKTRRFNRKFCLLDLSAPVTDSPAVFLFWRVRAVAARGRSWEPEVQRSLMREMNPSRWCWDVSN